MVNFKELNEKLDNGERVVVQTLEDMWFAQTSTINDFLTEDDNGVLAMQRLTNLIKYDFLEFKRDIDVDCKVIRELDSERKRESHDSWLIVPKDKKFFVKREQGKVLNGKRRGQPCWYYELVPAFCLYGLDISDSNLRLYDELIDWDALEII